MKMGQMYDVFCSYSIKHNEENELDREVEKAMSASASIELLDGSGAFDAIAVGATASFLLLMFWV